MKTKLVLLLALMVIAAAAAAQTTVPPPPLRPGEVEEEADEEPSAVIDDDSTPITAIYIDSKGQVGINTTKPAVLLDVNGELRASLVSGSEGSSPFLANPIGGVPFAIVKDGGKISFREVMASKYWGLKLKEGEYKSFIIDHPIDPERWLVHATLEGPEAAVYYRGSAQLVNGRAVVALPHYFEALTAEEGKTIQLTNIDGFDRLMVQTRGGRKISDGTFVVVSDDATSSQQFDWEVKAVRRDGPALLPEPRRDEIEVGGIGPYRFYRVK